MKIRLLLVAAFTVVLVIGIPCFTTKANGPDAFSMDVLNHGTAFDHIDFSAPEGLNGSPPNPLTHFEPGYLRLIGENSRITINGASVITQPANVPEIPEATTENQAAVLNQIRQVLIDSKLAVAPE